VGVFRRVQLLGVCGCWVAVGCLSLCHIIITLYASCSYSSYPNQPIHHFIMHLCFIMHAVYVEQDGVTPPPSHAAVSICLPFPTALQMHCNYCS
jgi:hypothetical protein